MDKITVTREELYNMVWTEPMSSFSKKYQISDLGLRKKCVKFNIPLPDNGYWSKIKYGKTIKKPRLPKEFKGKNEIVLCYRAKNGKYVEDTESPFEKLKKEIENNPTLTLKVPNILSNPDPLIISTKESLKTKSVYNWKFPETIETKDRELNINVSPKNVGRALRIMDTFIKLIKARNHTICIRNNKTVVTMYGIDEEISIKEKYNVVKKESTDSWRPQQYVPIGKLTLKDAGPYGKEFASDNKHTLLEDKLVIILAKMELYASDLRRRWDEIDRQRKINEEQERIRKEAEEQINIEKKKFESLIKDAKRLHQAKIIREYANYINSQNNNKSNELTEFVTWAKDKADWYDPTVNKEDKILGFYSESIQKMSID